MHRSLIEYTIKFSIGTKFIAKTIGQKSGPALGTAVGLALSTKELHDSIQSYRNPKFEVTFDYNGQHVTKIVRAKTGLDAISKLKLKYPTGSGFNYYRL